MQQMSIHDLLNSAESNAGGIVDDALTQLSADHAEIRASKMILGSQLARAVIPRIATQLSDGSTTTMTAVWQELAHGCADLWGVIDLEVVAIAYGLAFAIPNGLVYTNGTELTSTPLFSYDTD